MSESKELKAGDTVTYEIGGQKLILTPMPWGRLKKAFRLFSESWANIDKNDINDPAKFMKWVGITLEARMEDMFPLFFDIKQNEFFNTEWVEENITLSQIQKIIVDAIKINGVSDFLASQGKINKPSTPPTEIPSDPIPAEPSPATLETVIS